MRILSFNALIGAALLVAGASCMAPQGDLSKLPGGRAFATLFLQFES